MKRVEENTCGLFVVKWFKVLYRGDKVSVNKDVTETVIRHNSVNARRVSRKQKVLIDYLSGSLR